MGSAPKSVLITGFEPFGGRAVNRSQLLLEHVKRAASARKGRGHRRIVTALLPVSFDRLPAAVSRALAARPDAVILLGESAAATELLLERVAVNRIDARIADNAGKRPQGTAVVAGGPAAYLSTVPLKRALTTVKRAGAAARLSGDAGSFACNAAYYLALHELHRDGGQRPVLFVHLPVRARAVALRSAVRAVLALAELLGTSEGRRPVAKAPRRRAARAAAGPAVVPD